MSEIRVALLRGCISQLISVIKYKPHHFHTLNPGCHMHSMDFQGTVLGQPVPHVRNNRIIDLSNLPDRVQLWEAAVEYPN